MSFDQSSFTLIPLPQNVNADGLLQLNILFIPRNFSPLERVETIYNAAGAMPFINARPNFVVKVLNKSTEFPGKDPILAKPLELISLQYSAKIEHMYRTLKDARNGDGKPKYFDIDEERSTGKAGSAAHVAPAAMERDIAIRKYLPKTYREAFNFTSPRIKNAVTDDSYHCAMRDQSPIIKHPIDNRVSWGKVYAHLLRQPTLAMAAGLLYKTAIQLEGGDFEKGGWLYADLKDGSDYSTEMITSLDKINFLGKSPFIKRYAAKIPSLEPGSKRMLFTAIGFPVMNPGDTPDGTFDELFIEAARFNHGFATIVHAQQPRSQNLLKEEHDGLLPQKDIGVRLGWEDEQILVWYLRQMANEAGKTERTDAPLCVMGYNIDVRLRGDENEDTNPWESLNMVRSKGEMTMPGNNGEEPINLGEFVGELPYQVYPSKINTNTEANYWLPIYFANWNHKSIVIPDDDALRIYKNEVDNKHAVSNANPYLPFNNKTKLAYGKSYEFRVRLSDISGGGPAVTEKSFGLLSESHRARVIFKRYVSPDSVRIVNEAEILQPNTDDHNFNGGSLVLARPIMGYPGVLHTGKYTDPVQRLINASQAILDEQLSDPTKATGGRAFGIADPDVVSIQIKVEVETLQMDNLASDDGKQNFITLYTTNRTFNNWNEDNPDETINVPVRFVDEPVLDLTNKIAPFSAVADNASILATANEIVLPTARNIRITLRPQGLEQDNYWGLDPKDPSMNPRLGKTKVITIRRESFSEEKLFTGLSDPQVLQGIFLQPDPVEINPDAKSKRNLNGTDSNKMPDIVQRLAHQLNIEAKDKSLTAANGDRLQFWCSSRIRHNMAPDHSSITFANKNELQHHWLVCTTLTINRDWTWDSLDPLSFEIRRKFRFGADAEKIEEKSYEKIGDVEVKKTASFQAIQAGADGLVHRNYTKIIFIDAVDGTPVNGAFPDFMEVKYQINTRFRPLHVPAGDRPFETEVLLLPITVKPHQAPKLIGAGIALSPYIRNANYSSSEARRRYLWLEFEKGPEDANDELFTRTLAYAPDQLLSNNNPSLWRLEKDTPFNLDPEFIRVVIPKINIDHNGLKAMQQMTKSKDPDRHFYLLPLPPGLHSESPQLFGFFTQEFRFGHSERKPCTAQGRFFDPLRIAGLQFPAPTLACLLNRNEKEVSISTPYAQALFNGQDVTSNPPRTAIWALLYAQVKQADGKDYRNILLTELELVPNPLLSDSDLFLRFIFEKIRRIENQKLLDYEEGLPVTPYDVVALVKEIGAEFLIEKQKMVRQANGQWNNKDINQVLDLYGLPTDTSLSVVCVEVFGQITNIKEQINKLEFVETNEQVPGGLLNSRFQTRRIIKDNVLVNSENNYVELVNQMRSAYGVEIPAKGDALEAFNRLKPRPMVKPLSDSLGHYRILRTSPLTEVPFVCCTEESDNSLGLLSLRGSLVCDFAIPDKTIIDGWTFDKSNCTVQCTGDIDNDGIDEIIITDAKGMAVVKYSKGGLRLIFRALSKTPFGEWLYDDPANGSGDYGYKIAPFTGEQNELLLISKQGIVTLVFQQNTFTPTRLLKNGQVFCNWKVNTNDRLVGVARLFSENETNIVFENNIDMHLVSMRSPEQTFTARTGVRYGQWLFSRVDNKIQCFGDFNGDGVDEIFISSPWGIGILKWSNGILTAIAMIVNGTNVNGYVVDNKHVFGSVGNYLAKKNQEIVVHNNSQLLAVLILNNGTFNSLNLPNKNFVTGDLAGEFVAKLDRDEKSDWVFKNAGAVYVVNVDETTGIEINNIIGMNADINGWKIKVSDLFVGAGNFIGREKERQMLIVAGK
ncbi:MAG: hypothetical protein M3040_00895 [Bacteroidota bacterium]|nr:hypothetical protein [Bacteroidota bacterium]